MGWVKLILLLLVRLPSLLAALDRARAELSEREFNERIDNLNKSKGGQETAKALFDLFARK